MKDTDTRIVKSCESCKLYDTCDLRTEKGKSIYGCKKCSNYQMSEEMTEYQKARELIIREGFCRCEKDGNVIAHIKSGVIPKLEALALAEGERRTRKELAEKVKALPNYEMSKLKIEKVSLSDVLSIIEEKTKGGDINGSTTQR